MVAKTFWIIASRCANQKQMAVSLFINEANWRQSWTQLCEDENVVEADAYIMHGNVPVAQKETTQTKTDLPPKEVPVKRIEGIPSDGPFR